jgi:hypothetical protein
MKMTRFLCCSLGVFGWWILSALAAMAQASPTPSRHTLIEILSDSALWGKNFPMVLASLRSWDQAGQRSVLVFPNRIVGGTPLSSPEKARETSRSIAETMTTRPFKPKPQFQAMFGTSQLTPHLKTEIIARFQDDDSARVVATQPDAQFFAPDLTIDKVKERLGPPEKVEQQVIQSEGDRRPVILTLNRYAGGAVVFAQSDVAARPESVNRVLLDASAVMNAIEAK